MGFTPGSLAELEHADLPGEPLEFKVKGYHVSLSKDEASKIIVEPL